MLTLLRCCQVIAVSCAPDGTASTESSVTFTVTQGTKVVISFVLSVTSITDAMLESLKSQLAAFFSIAVDQVEILTTSTNSRR